MGRVDQEFNDDRVLESSSYLNASTIVKKALSRY